MPEPPEGLRAIMEAEHKSFSPLYNSVVPELPPSADTQCTGVTHWGAAACTSLTSHPGKSRAVALH